MSAYPNYKLSYTKNQNSDNPSKNKTKLNPKRQGPTYFSECRWHGKDSAISIGLLVCLDGSHFFLVHPVHEHQHQCKHEDNGRHFIIERKNSDQNMSGGTDCSEHQVGLACLPGLTTRAKPTSAKSVKVRQSHSNVTSDRVEIVERLVRKLPKWKWSLGSNSSYHRLKWMKKYSWISKLAPPNSEFTCNMEQVNMTGHF